MIAEVASDLILGLGLLLLMEGLVYALAPSIVETLLALLRSMDLSERRKVGFAALALGLALVVLAKTLGG